MPTRDEAVALIKQRMGNNNDSSLDAHIITEMKQAQVTLELEATLPWFLVEKGETSVAAATRTFTPSAEGGRDFIMQFPDIPVYVYKDDGIETEEDKVSVPSDDYRDMWDSYKDTADAYPPLRYSTELSDLHTFAFFPRSDLALKAVVYGYYKDAILSTNVTNKWLTYAPEVMIGLTGKIIAGFYVAFEKYAAGFAAVEAEARMKLEKKTIVWEENFVRRMMGDS